MAACDCGEELVYNLRVVNKSAADFRKQRGPQRRRRLIGMAGWVAKVGGTLLGPY